MDKGEFVIGLCMSLQNIQIENEYRNLHGNIIHDFYNPLLSEAVVYNRSVGFFSSTAFRVFPLDCAIS